MNFLIIYSYLYLSILNFIYMPYLFILKFANLKNFVLELTQLLGKLKYNRLNLLTWLHELHLYLKRQINNLIICISLYWKA